MQYDVIVVGARCAGAPTAMLLARNGYKVLLLDRATFPSDIPHGHLIHRHGPKRLHRWGLLERIVADGAPPISAFTLDVGGIELSASDIVADEVAFAVGPRRISLDKILVDAAVQAGAELREGFVVDDIITEGDRVVGVRGRERSGATSISEHATIIVGVDGRNSLLARKAGAPSYEATPPLTCWYFSYWSGVQRSGLEVHVRQNRCIFAFPTNDDLFAIFIAWPASELASVRADIEGQFMAVLAYVPTLAERVRQGRREERFYGATDLPNFLRRPFAPGWALVGDAGCHKDPYLALGVCDALRDAELLSEALHEGLSGERPFDIALADYERRRNESTTPDYRENIEMAQFTPPPPQMTQMLAALQGNPEDARRFFLAREGLIPPASFFNPENMQRIVAAAGAPQRGA